MKNIIYFSLITLLFASCENEIDIDLYDVDSQFVIEGTITNQPGPYTIKIAQTTDYFEPSDYKTVSFAIVNITDSEGNFETLLETEPGIYQSNSTQGVIDRTYKLYVNIDGQEFRASSFLPDITQIDSLSYQKNSFLDKNNENYIVSCYFHDLIDIENYYRIKLYKNSVLSDNLYLTGEQLLDGKDIDIGLLMDEIELDDTVVVELMNTDKDVFVYYNSLSSIMKSEEIASSTPANPTSNISNGALGYFGAYSFTRDTIIIN